MDRDVAAAVRALVGHRFYRYRGCAPDLERPDRAAGDLRLSIDAWGARTADGAEPAREREARQAAAKAVCGRCPVLVECRVWANSVGDDGRLVDEHSVAGGQTSLERSRLRIAALQSEAVGAGGTGPSRQDVEQCRTAPRQAVLRALAGCVDEHAVAGAAGMDLRTANWHRSHLCRLLGLDRATATRAELLDAAAAAGVLPAGVVVAADGGRRVPAAPVSDGTRQRHVEAGLQLELELPVVVPAGADTGRDVNENRDELMERAA